MSDQIAKDHFRWIGHMADRIISSKSEKNPLLSLSFLEDRNDILQFFSQFSRPSFPITKDKLIDGKLYGIVVSAVAPNSDSKIEFLFNFELILKRLKEKGYVPEEPCDCYGLSNGELIHHINLCKVIEFLVVDRCININLLKEDLNNLPRSFFAMKSDAQIFHLEDAMSLWLSKFHCISDFSDEYTKIECTEKVNTKLNDKIYSMQMDTAKYAKVAACLSRAFPEKIDKEEIQNGDDEDDVNYNIKISRNILDKMNAFVIDRFPTDEHLFMLFVSELFYATRSCVKKFIVYDHPVFVFEPHLPGENKGKRSPRMNRRALSKKINLSYFLSGPIDQLEERKEKEDYETNEGHEEEIYNIITPYSTLQDIKDGEEFILDDAREDEKFNIITPYNSLQDIKDGEESNFVEAKEEEKYNIVTPYSSLQNIKDDEESNIVWAKDEEKYNIITPHNTLQNIKDEEELNYAEAKEEEKYNIITPHNTLQNIKDEEESIFVEAKEEEKYNIVTPYSSLQEIKDDEESKVVDAKEEEKYNIITPYSTLQDIKDEEECKLQNNVKEFKGLLDMNSSKNIRKIFKPLIEPKGTKN